MVAVSMISLPVTHLISLFGGKNIDYNPEFFLFLGRITYSKTTL